MAQESVRSADILRGGETADVLGIEKAEHFGLRETGRCRERFVVCGECQSITASKRSEKSRASGGSKLRRKMAIETVEAEARRQSARLQRVRKTIRVRIERMRLLGDQANAQYRRALV